MKIERNYLAGVLRLLPLLPFLTNATFAIDPEQEKILARYKKNLTVAEAKCGTDAQITVQLKQGSAVTGSCLFLSVDYVTMKLEKGIIPFGSEAMLLKSPKRLPRMMRAKQRRQLMSSCANLR